MSSPKKVYFASFVANLPILSLFNWWVFWDVTTSADLIGMYGGMGNGTNAGDGSGCTCGDGGGGGSCSGTGTGGGDSCRLTPAASGICRAALERIW